MKECKQIRLACPQCEEILDTKWFDEKYVVAVCKKCLCASTAHVIELVEEDED